ncbi:MAG: SpoIIE family protein phosphatase [Kouleothrix sp.]
MLGKLCRLPGWEISAISLPAHDLSGDLYDFLPMARGWHGIMIGDVSGRACPLPCVIWRWPARYFGMRLGAMSHQALHWRRRTESYVEIPQGMVTMLYVKLNTQHGEVHIANAGHTCPVIINGKVSELELSGLPLGVDDESEYEEAHAYIQPGNTVVLYTDGVIEGRAARGAKSIATRSLKRCFSCTLR